MTHSQMIEASGDIPVDLVIKGDVSAVHATTEQPAPTTPAKKFSSLDLVAPIYQECLTEISCEGKLL